LTTGVGYTFTIIVGFLGLAIAARHLQPEKFGVYVLLEIVVSLFAVLSDVGIGLSTTRHIAAATDIVAVETYVNSVISWRLFTCLVLGLLTLLCKPIILYIFKSLLLAEFTLFIAIFGSLTSLDLLLSYILRGFQSYKNLAIAQALASGLKALLIVVFLVILKLDLIGLVYACMIPVSVSVLWQYMAIPGQRKWSISFPVIKKLMNFGFPLGINSMLTFVFQKTDALIIGTFLNPVQVAYYGIASKIPDSLLRFFQFFETVYLPSVSESHENGQRGQTTALINNSLRLISFVSTVAVLVTLLFQREIIGLLFGEQYLASAPILPLLMVALNMEVILYVLGNTLVAIGQSDKPLKCNVVTTIANIAGSLFMIPILGINGAAYAKILSRYLANPINTWFLSRSKYAVDTIKYFAPIFILGGIWLMFSIQNEMRVFFRLLIICMFLSSAFLLRIVSIRDLQVFFEAIGSFRASSRHGDG